MTDQQIAQLVQRIDAIRSDDRDLARDKAEIALLDFMPTEVTDAYTRLCRRCGWWIPDSLVEPDRITRQATAEGVDLSDLKFGVFE